MLRNKSRKQSYFQHIFKKCLGKRLIKEMSDFYNNQTPIETQNTNTKKVDHWKKNNLYKSPYYPMQSIDSILLSNFCKQCSSQI